MAIQHTKEFGIYHWDTFDNVTLLVGEADTKLEAVAIVEKEYGDRISCRGADKVDIVDSNGVVVEDYCVC